MVRHAAADSGTNLIGHYDICERLGHSHTVLLVDALGRRIAHREGLVAERHYEIERLHLEAPGHQLHL